MINTLFKLFILYLFLLLFAFNFAPLFSQNIGEQQFVYLAHAFLNKSLSLITLPPRIDDLVYFQGKYFWPLGAFPAIILMPFVNIFGTNFNQGFIQFPLSVINFLAIVAIGQKLNLSKKSSYLLATFFIFGSTYTPIATLSFSWYFAHIVAVTCLLLAIHEFLNQKRWLVIGPLIAFATLTRFNIILASIFFLLDLLKKPVSYKKLFTFLVPIFIAVFGIFLYNFLRFGDMLESGYSYQIIPRESSLRRDYGLVSLQHVPANLYYMLLKTPDPVLKDDSHVLKFPYLKYDPYGMSITILSPILLLIFRTKLKDKYVKRSILTVFLLLITIITYYGIGYIQVGYRYALDFFPFLIIILASALRRTRLHWQFILVLTGILISWFFSIEKMTGF